jgi:hypothetical protein
MTDLTPFASSLAAILAALARARYQLVHASPDQLPAPYYLVEGDINFPALTRTTGTVVVTGALTVTGPLDLHQDGRPIVNLIVAGTCSLGLAYVDAFLCVGGDLKVGTLIADSNWSGGVFVAGDLTGHTLVIKDVGVDVDGNQHVERVADCEDEEAAQHVLPGLFEDGHPEPRGLFIALRDSSGARAAKPAKESSPKAKPTTARAKASKAKPKASKARAKPTRTKAKPTKTKAKPTKTKAKVTKAKATKATKTKATKTKTKAKAKATKTKAKATKPKATVRRR